MAEIKVLLTGYFDWLSESTLKASSTVTLIKDEGKNIIVDTGSLRLEKELLKKLKKENIKPEDIDIVVNTHSHSDHRGNNHLFKNAILYVQSNTIKDDIYNFFSTLKTISLTKNVKIIQTPGHSVDDISVIVETKKGVYAVTGDLFFINQKEEPEFVDDIIKLKENREKIIALADYIIPGHADAFKVKQYD